MPLSPTVAPTDLNAIATNAGVLIVALGMAFAGVWQGMQRIKKLMRGDSPPPADGGDQKKILSAAIMETVSIREWSETNRAVAEQTRQLCNRFDDLLEELRDSRSVNRDLIEENRKLRSAVSELESLAKAFRR